MKRQDANLQGEGVFLGRAIIVLNKKKIYTNILAEMN